MFKSKSVKIDEPLAGQPAVQCQGLSFQYETTLVLNQIDFAIKPGSFVTMIGPNGSGKSTLLRCINRIHKVNKNRLCLFGHDVMALTQRQIAQWTAYIPQMQDSSDQSVFDYVMMGRYPHLFRWFRNTRQDEAVVRRLLGETKLKDVLDRPVRSLSGGEQQRVFLAACLAQEPKVLLLDEPTNHLDPRHQRSILSFIVRVAKQQAITIVHITHDLNHIGPWCDQVLALKEGRVKFNGHPDDVMTAENLAQLYDVPFDVIRPDQGQRPYWLASMAAVGVTVSDEKV